MIELIRALNEDRPLCSNHITDNPIKAFIKKTGSIGECSYCGKKKNVTSFIKVASFIKKGILRFYGDANNEGCSWDKEEQKSLVATYDTEELLKDKINLRVDNDLLMCDLIDYLGDGTWCKLDPYGDDEDEELSYNWDEFKRVVKHVSRYVFFGSKQFKSGMNGAYVDNILYEIGKRVNKLKLFSTLEPGTDFYRCRRHSFKKKPVKAEDFTSPSNDEAKFPNRMSPAGISMFYAAFNPETAYEETLDPNSKFPIEIMSTGVFKNNKELTLINLARLPPLPSIFDQKKSSDYYSMVFLEKFVNDLSATVAKDGSEHIEYIPTQIITEYFRYTHGDLTGKIIDGIIYPSSRNPGNEACVLFFDQSQCLEKMDFLANRVHRKPIPRLTII
ncbi:HEPN-associated N-terminal domain-containing protein [Mucilaginibacter sp.]|uniref:HEPN-associated N-terminal domain-containing protein n=1 Tax=Mucilaginibacter sp. TaxID=1882438 RepID=UPI00260303D8|nr:HEPN-associated N-terminal domain-containing protein [Mucilaginibacter sp.]MDB4925484.1 hypothetical protein [Mucilaginibacter sp.]